MHVPTPSLYLFYLIYVYQRKVHIIQDGQKLQTSKNTRQQILWRWSGGNKALLLARLFENWKHVYGGRSAQLIRTQDVFLCWMFPAVLQENPDCGGSLHCKAGTAAELEMTPCASTLRASQEQSHFHLCQQTILPPGQPSIFTAGIFSCQPHS